MHRHMIGGKIQLYKQVPFPAVSAGRPVWVSAWVKDGLYQIKEDLTQGESSYTQ